jgi:hypothetical protein
MKRGYRVTAFTDATALPVSRLGTAVAEFEDVLEVTIQLA